VFPTPTTTVPTRKLVLAPDDDAGRSLGVAVRRPDGLDVTLSGLPAAGPRVAGDPAAGSSADPVPADPTAADVESRLRDAVSAIREVICDGLGGELMDVTHLRVAVVADALDAEAEAAIERVRRQAFEWPHYPSITTVGTATLADGALVSVEAAAFVPDDGWEAEVLTFADE
jgi:hypothetical protein